jgi:hypothetical protein
MNLFWATRSQTNSREDHLTEFFAAALEISPLVRSRYFDLVLKDFAKRKGWSSTRIAQIETQFWCDETTCRPDMLLILDDGKRIICEHKLEAVETVGPEIDDRLQLERYLDLRIDGLLYVRASWKTPAGSILKHPKYIRPKDREHFLWRDFYPLLDGVDDVFVEWLRDGFRNLGFTPPHAAIGDLWGSDEVQVRQNRLNFAKLWTRTRTMAANLGWEVATGAIVQLYFNDNETSLASEVFIQPKGDMIHLRVTPRQKSVDDCRRLLGIGTEACFVQTEMMELQVPRKAGKALVFDLTASLADVLGRDVRSVAQIEENLCRFVQHFVAPLQLS